MVRKPVTPRGEDSRRSLEIAHQGLLRMIGSAGEGMRGAQKTLILSSCPAVAEGHIKSEQHRQPDIPQPPLPVGFSPPPFAPRVLTLHGHGLAHSGGISVDQRFSHSSRLEPV
jgi:hypothetical protein